jgi:DNA polymerase-3 subunit alpha
MTGFERFNVIMTDFKSFNVIKYTEELIRRRGGEYADFNINTIPESDEAAFNMLGDGESYAVFQLESERMPIFLKHFRPSCIKDLIALNEPYCPGPIYSLPDFINRRWGRQTVKYSHPVLEDILKETYGIIIFREQIIQIAHIVAGYSLDRADLLRRTLKEKNSKTMAVEKRQFISNALKRGYSEQEAGKIFKDLIPCSRYAFDKSSATANALLVYQKAYLKANFPAEFMAAYLSGESKGDIFFSMDTLPGCITKTRRLGIIVEPPDINKSEKNFTVVDGCIISGFCCIKNISDTEADAIISNREKRPYREFLDFLIRMYPKVIRRTSIVILINSGVFDSFGEDYRTSLRKILEEAYKEGGVLCSVKE